LKIRLGQRLGPCQEEPLSRNEEVCPKERANCVLHPLIHTFAPAATTQNMVFYQSEEKKPPLTRRSQWGHKTMAGLQVGTLPRGTEATLAQGRWKRKPLIF
jgi:hypothetical protein